MTKELKAFLAKYRNNKVPVKMWGKRGYDSERYKPDRSKRIESNYYHC